MVRNLITSIDFLGPAANLKVNSKPRYQTLFGGVLSILAGLAVLVVSGYFVITTFSRDTTSVTLNTKRMKFPKYEQYKAPIFWTIFNAYAAHEPDSKRIFDMTYQVTEWVPSTGKMETVMYPIQYPCNDHFKQYYPEFKDILGGNQIPLYCVDPKKMIEDKVTIKNNFGDAINGFSFGVLEVRKCRNNTAIGKTDCFSDEHINTFVKNFYIPMYTVNNEVDNFNQTHPGQVFLQENVLPVSTSLHKLFEFFVREVNYKTDVGYLYEIIQEDKFSIHEPRQEIYTLDSTSETMVAPLYYHASSTGEYYNRSYLKLQSLLANIGGIVKGVMLISSMIERYVVDTLFTLSLSGLLIDFESYHAKEPKEKNGKPSEFVMNDVKHSAVGQALNDNFMADNSVTKFQKFIKKYLLFNFNLLIF